MKLHEKLIEIQSSLVVAKNKHNNFGDFNYRSCEDILKEVKPLLKEHGVVLLLTDEVVFIGDKHYVKAIAKISDGVDIIEVSALAREPASPKPKMDDSQTTGSTSSYARKYALSGLFGLDDGIDSDAVNKGKSKKETTETQSDAPKEKLITKKQIETLKGLGFSEERLKKMATYYKVEDVSKITYKQAQEAIDKQNRAVEKAKAGANNG